MAVAVAVAGEEEEPRGGARHGRDLIGYACSSASHRAEGREADAGFGKKNGGGEGRRGERREEAAPRDRTTTARWRRLWLVPTSFPCSESVQCWAWVSLPGRFGSRGLKDGPGQLPGRCPVRKIGPVWVLPPM